MTDIIVDSNIFFNVWWRESDPRTGYALWKTSSDIIDAVKGRRLHGYVCAANLLEMVHAAHRNAVVSGKDPKTAAARTLKNVIDFNFREIAPDALHFSKAISFTIDLHLDPFDALMLAVAVDEAMDAIISRDKKLKKKASKLIPVLTPEEFLS